VLDSRTLYPQSHLVPLTDRTHRLAGGSVERVVGAGRRLRILTVAVARVVQHLHFGARLPGPVLFLGDPEHDAAVAALRDLPLQSQLEISELFNRHEVAASPHRAEVESPALHHPAVWQLGVAEASPTCQGPAIEQRLEPVSLLLRVQRDRRLLGSRRFLGRRCGTSSDYQANQS
jgi:hypothetical protein